MPKDKDSGGSLSQRFHEIMLATTASASPHPPSTPQGTSSPYYAPSISQRTYSPRESPLKANTKANSQAAARPFRSTAGSSEEGAYTELQEKYKLLQRGFLTLELKYNRRKEELTQLRKELQVQAEGHTLRTNELTGEIGAKEGKLEELRSEFKNVAHATRAVKGIVGQVVSELAIQLKCPVCLGLLQVPHSLSCFHVACCACVIDTFQRIGAKCSICWQSCTQLPRQDAVIAGILSVVYKLQDVEEPTLASLGLDPGVFTKFFQTSAEQLPDNLQVKIQHQPETVQEVAPAQQQGHFDLDDGGGAAPGHVHQHAHHGEGAVGGAAEALVTASDVGTSGPSQVVGFLGFSFDTQDVAMGEETGN